MKSSKSMQLATSESAQDTKEIVHGTQGFSKGEHKFTQGTKTDVENHEKYWVGCCPPMTPKVLCDLWYYSA